MHRASPPSVNHWSTSHIGGAGIAARHLNRMLNASGQESTFNSSWHKNFDIEKNEIFWKRDLYQSVIGKGFTAANLLIGDDPFFSLVSKSSFEASILDQSLSSVIHLHNYYNLISDTGLSRLSNNIVPLILTVHDQRLLTGGCHYAVNCNLFRFSCHKCPMVPPFFFSRVAGNKASRLTMNPSGLFIISPSTWLYELIAEVYPHLKTNLYQIENVLDYRSIAINASVFQSSQIRIGFAANMPAGRTKGAEIVEAFEKSGIPRKHNMCVVTPKYFGFQMNKFWESIDILLVPSLIDNHPNVITEAHIRGIPVCSSNVGGIPEMLYADFDVSCERSLMSPARLAEIILETKKHFSSEMSLKARNLTINRIDEALMRHISLYKELSHQVD